MKRKNIFLTLIISGFNYPGKNMNVYMQLFKDESEEVWDNGVKIYDAGRAGVCVIFWMVCVRKDSVFIM